MKGLLRIFLSFTLMFPGAVKPAISLEKSFEDVARSIVSLRAAVPDSARTSDSLGTEREGNGIVIDHDGLVLTIGYLILEAASTEVTDRDGNFVAADIVAYDHASGFGLVRARTPLKIDPMPFGDSAALEVGTPALALSRGGPRPVTPVKLVSRRDFAGYWEYLLEDAMFTVPPHPLYGGAALLDRNGHLVGVGSLMVNDAAPADAPIPGNMFVPINALKPIFQDLLQEGRRKTAGNPWLGLFTAERAGRVIVLRVAPDGPSEQAGIKPGDLIMGVEGRRVGTLAEFYRKVWSKGPAGADVKIDVLPIGEGTLDIKQVSVKSRDRYDWLRLNGL